MGRKEKQTDLIVETEGCPVRKSRTSGFGIGFLVGVLVSTLLCLSIVGFFTIRSVLNRTNVPQVQEQDESHKAVSENTLKKLQVIEDIIKANYALEMVDESTMEEGIYKGLVDSLGDPYSMYSSAEEMKVRNDKMKGIFYGIGSSVIYDEEMGYCRLREIFEDSPAQKAGLKNGDFVVKVDGKSTYNKDLSEVVSMIRGEKDTPVVLTIYREGESDNLEITVIRGEVKMQTINSKMMDGDIAYIRIQEFDSVTADQFTDAMVTMKGQGMKGLVLDLRNNPGGNLNTVADMCREFLPKGLIVYTEDNKGEKRELTCDGKKEIDVPLVVLVNGGSASASEIMAGAVKDYGIGTLVGTKTFGKGIVQKYITLSDGSSVKLTTSKYYTPSGKNIHGVGIEPDVEEKLDVDAFLKEGVDNQLQKAIEIINSEINQ